MQACKGFAIDGLPKPKLRVVGLEQREKIGSVPTGEHCVSMKHERLSSCTALDEGGIYSVQCGAPGSPPVPGGPKWALVVNPRGTPQQLNQMDCGLAVMLCARDVVLRGAGRVHATDDMAALWKHPDGVPPEGYVCTPFSYTGADIMVQLRSVVLTEVWMSRLLHLEPCWKVSETKSGDPI